MGPAVSFSLRWAAAPAPAPAPSPSRATAVTSHSTVLWTGTFLEASTVVHRYLYPRRSITRRFFYAASSASHSRPSVVIPALHTTLLGLSILVNRAILPHLVPLSAAARDEIGFLRPACQGSQWLDKTLRYDSVECVYCTWHVRTWSEFFSAFVRQAWSDPGAFVWVTGARNDAAKESRVKNQELRVRVGTGLQTQTRRVAEARMVSG